MVHTESTPAAAWQPLVAVTEAIAAQPKRLQKAQLAAAYLAGLADPDLALAARFLAGQPFALWDPRTVQLGPAALLAALATCSGQPLEALRPQLVQAEDLGALAASIWPLRPDGDGPTLAAVAADLARLATTRGSGARRDLLVEQLRPLTGPQARLYLRLLLGALRLGLKEGVLEAAIARAAGVDLGAVQRANMLLGDLGETAVRARQGCLDDVGMRPFHPLKFMLASPVQDAAAATVAAAGAPRAVEDKYDGIRAQVHLARADSEPGPTPSAPRRGVLQDGVRLAIFTRSLDEITASFPDLWSPLAALLAPDGVPAALVLDGEILAARGADILPFTALQPRLGRRRPTTALQVTAPVAFVAFDLLAEGAQSLLPAAHRQRRARLVHWVPADAAAPVRCAPSQLCDEFGDLDVRFAAARARGNEGLLLKDPAAPYVPGRRGRDWLKLKKPLATLDVVVTAAEVGHGRRRSWLSDYTFAVRRSGTDATLLNVGKAYSGLTDAEIADLTVWFRAHTRTALAHGRVCLVEPHIVLEVAFDRVQRSPRHKSGFALRFPRILRRRVDKALGDIDTLAALRALCPDPRSA